MQSYPKLWFERIVFKKNRAKYEIVEKMGDNNRMVISLTKTETVFLIQILFIKPTKASIEK